MDITNIGQNRIGLKKLDIFVVPRWEESSKQKTTGDETKGGRVPVKERHPHSTQLQLPIMKSRKNERN